MESFLTLKANLFRTLFQPSLEATFRRHTERIQQQIGEVGREIKYCHMSETKQVSSGVQSLIVREAHRLRIVETPILLLPYCQKENFFGRQEILDQLKTKLDPTPSQSRQRRFALYGLAGCGKTQTALEYV